MNRAIANQALSPARDMPWSQVVDTYWRNGAAQRQPYLRGELLALRLDALARQRGTSIDDVFKRLATDAAAHSGVVTQASVVQAFAASVGADVARDEVERALAGGIVRLPENMFANLSNGCATPVIDTLAPWDPGFDVDASIRSRTVAGVRASGPAYRAGLRDSMRLTSVSVYRGDPTRNIVLGIRDSVGDRKITWLPVGEERVPVQRWRLIAGKRC